MKYPHRWSSLGVLAWMMVACSPAAAPSVTTGEDGGSSSSGAMTSASGSEGGSTAGVDTGSDPTHDTSSGSDTTVGGDTSTAGPSDSSDGGTMIPCEGTCQPHFDGWNGPVMALHQFEETLPKQCALPWGDEIAVLHDALHGDDASCSCECGEAHDVSCGPTMLRRQGNGCTTVQSSIPLSFGCNDITGVTNSDWRLEYPEPTGGSCDPVAQTDVPPAYWSRRVTLCGLDDSWNPAGECDGTEQCAATPLVDEAVCYWLEGEHQCPAGEREIYYADYADDRGCDACTCGEPEGVCGTFGNFPQPAYADDDCTVGAGSIDETACSHINGTVEAVYLGPVGSNTSCTANPVGPTGGVQPTGAVTLCCGFESME